MCIIIYYVLCCILYIVYSTVFFIYYQVLKVSLGQTLCNL